MEGGGICMTLVEKEPTEADIAFSKKCAIDWMWWCFLIGVPIHDIARDLEKEVEKIQLIIDRIIHGDVTPTILRPMLVNTPWTSRHDKLLLKLKSESHGPAITADLLSRTVEEVKRRLKQIEHV